MSKFDTRLAYLFSVFIGLVCLVPTDAALARDWYVDNVGGDDKNNGSEQAKLRSIGKALKYAEAGDRIFLTNSGQPYRESITLNGTKHSGLDYLGSSLSTFRIIGNGATLDGRTLVDDRLWEHFEGDVFRFRPKKMSFQVLYNGDRPAQRIKLKSIRPSKDELSAGQWALSRGWIYFCTEKGRDPASYLLSCCKLQVGITLYKVKGVSIEGLDIQGFHLDGINAHDLATEVSLDSVRCRGNGRSGISVGGASSCTISNCVLGDNAVSQFRSESSCHATISESKFSGDTIFGPLMDVRGGKIDVDGRPVKVDRGG